MTAPKVCPSCGEGKVVDAQRTPSGLALKADQYAEACDSCPWWRCWFER